MSNRERDAEMAAMRRKGATFREISEKYGITPGRAWIIIKKQKEKDASPSARKAHRYGKILSARAFHVICNQIGLGPNWTLEQLRCLGMDRIRQTPNCGIVTFNEIERLLEQGAGDE